MEIRLATTSDYEGIVAIDEIAQTENKRRDFI